MIMNRIRKKDKILVCQENEGNISRYQSLFRGYFHKLTRSMPQFSHTELNSQNGP